jgi:Tol biopolymer transport system component
VVAEQEVNKYFTQHYSTLFLLFGLALSSGCGQSTITVAPTSTPAPSQTLTDTATPTPTNTPEPIHPEGTLVYLASGNITTVNLQNQESRTISIPATSYNLFFHTMVVGNDIYIANNTDEPLHRSEIIKISPNGSTVEQLLPITNKYWLLYCGKMSPNKRYLLCYYEKGLRSIFVIDIETKSTQTIPAEGDRTFQSISWSPDSKKLYLLDAVSLHSIDGVPVMGVHERGRLLGLSLETNKLSEILPDLSNPGVRWSDQTQIAGWSPSGINLLINLACNSNSTDIVDHPYIFNVDDRTTMQIKVDGCISKFEWSPDSTKIALTMFDENAHSDLFIYDISSQNLQKIPANGKAVFSFAWSPNGKHILFSVFSFQGPQNGIYLLNVSDDSVVQVMPNEKYSYTYQAHDFTWSPTGDRVLFMQAKRELDGQELYLFNADTKTVTLVERQDKGAWYFYQMWSPDGKYFIFVGGNPTRTLMIHNAYSGEQIEIMVPNGIADFTTDIYWIINDSVYHSGGPN